MKALQEYWASRDTREQKLLLICAGLAVLVMLYWSWFWLHQQQQKLQRELPLLQQQHQQLQALIEQQPQSPAANQWQQATQARWLTLGVNGNQAQLAGGPADQQHWQFKQLVFGTWVQWAAAIEQDYPVQMRELELKPAGPGQINGRLIWAAR